MADFLRFFYPDLLRFFTAHGGVKRVPIGIGDHGGVICRFHAAFDFKTVDARIDQLIEMLDHTQITGIHNEGALVLADLKELARPCLLDKMVLPAARLRTLAAVGVAPGQVVGQ